MVSGVSGWFGVPKLRTTGVENPLMEVRVTGTTAGVVLLPPRCTLKFAESRVNVKDGGPVYAATLNARVFEVDGDVDASPG